MFLILIGIALSLFINIIVMTWHLFDKEIFPYLKLGFAANTSVGDVAVFPLSNLLNWAAGHDWYIVRKIAKGFNTLPLFGSLMLLVVLFGWTVLGIASTYDNFDSKS